MSFEAEKSVIGCLLLDKENITEVSHILRPEMFCDSFLGRAYFEIMSMNATGVSIDAVILSQRLKDTVHSEQDIVKQLAEIVQGSFTTESVKAYAAIIIREYRARKAEEIVSKTEYRSDGIEKTIRDTVASLEALLVDEEQDATTVPAMVEDYADGYFKPDERPRIMLGFHDLDQNLGGLRGGDVIVLGARPKVGKSAFALQIARHFEKLGVRTGYFNLEMTKKQIFERIVSSVGGLELNRIRNGTRYLEGEEEKYKKALEELRKMKNLTIFSGGKSVNDIRAETKDFDVIIIDYLQLIKTDGKRVGNRYAEVGDISRAIKSIAIDFDIPVILLSQLNRASELKTDKEPSSADLRESGDIEQDASVVLLLWSPEKDNEQKRMIKIELNRQGKRCREELEFDGAHMTFYETENFHPNYEEIPFD